MIIKLLDDFRNKYIFFNTNYIVSLYQAENGMTDIHTIDGDIYTVRETPETILKMLCKKRGANE